MSTKIRVEKIPSEDMDDWEDDLLEEEEFIKHKKRNSFNGKRRKDIEDVLEERRLKKQISYSFEDIPEYRA